MNSIDICNTNSCDLINQLPAIKQRSSLLESGFIEFQPSENKLPSARPLDLERSLTKIVISKDSSCNFRKQINVIDHNKNSLSNSHIITNGKSTPSKDISAHKEYSNHKDVEDGIPVPKTVLYSGKISVDWKQVHKIGAGLHNLGNTCFMNTVIQCLTYCPPLANYLLHDNDHSSKCKITGFCMMCLLQSHMKRAIGKAGDIIRPDEMYHRLKSIAKHFQYGRQEDAHEYLRYVIDNLWKSCLSQNGFAKLDSPSKETTVINKIFGGYHRSQVTCLKCKGKSNTFDHFMDFILDIKQNVTTLQKALEKFIQPELLEQENSYKCPKCKMKVTAHKKFTVYKAPTVATFQLKRFDYNRSFGGKITKQIYYPEKLNLRPYMSEPKGEPVMYKLNAVLVHSGSTCNSGHYFCYVKNSNGLWYIMDDSRVCQVNLKTVLEQTAYVLFYIKSVSTENTSSKKLSENGNPYVKINSSVCNFKKTNDAKPLMENNQARQLSFKQHSYPAVNLNKRVGLSPNMNSLNVNQEKVAFEIRNQTPKSQNSCTVSSAKNEMKSFQKSHKTDNHQTGLVPYIEDSSESSDDSGRIKTSFKQSGESVDSLKSVNSTGSRTGTFFNIKRKPPKPVLDSNRLLNNSNSTSSKVFANGSSWTVTSAQVASPGADSNSSFNSVHSTSDDWQVTISDSEQNHTSEIKNEKTDSSLPSIQGPNQLENHSMKVDVKSPPNGTNRDELCNFRSQKMESGDTFLAKKENGHREHPNVLIKRKLSDSNQGSSTSTKSCNSEIQNGFVSKKVKLDDPEDVSLNSSHNVNSPNRSTTFSERNYSSNSDFFTYKNNSPNKYKSPQSTNSTCETNWLQKTNKDDSRNDRIHNSSSEYESVEKVKQNTDSSPFKGISYSKDPKKFQFNKNNQKPNVVEELDRNSKFFYASSVPTWNGQNRYRESESKKRKQFDDYENEYDRGKTRKFKPSDRGGPFRNQNPFQGFNKNGHNKYGHKYGHNNYGHNKYEFFKAKLVYRKTKKKK